MGRVAVWRFRRDKNSRNRKDYDMSELSVQTPEASAVSLIREVMAAGKSPEYLRELLAVRRDWEADEARKLYNTAIAEFQRRAPIIEKADQAYDKTYARMDRIWREIRPLLTELGLSVTWQICELKGEGDGLICHVEGQLRHRAGHGERLAMDIPLPEILKGQNAAQRMGSASTYAKRYALTAALGLVTGDDDDGHRAGHTVSNEQAHELEALLDACRGLKDFSEPKFWEWLKCETLGEIPTDRFGDAKRMLQKKLKDSK